MFFKQIRRNAAKNRKSNGLFFSALLVAIVAFYTLLSLSDQDVMRFLKTMEGDAIGKLMLLIPTIYMVSLFFVYFLVYFAYRYQLDSRKREFGMYLMFGMKRSSLFVMLMGETIWNSILSVLLGLPIALFITEVISLTTAKLVGLGIIGHKISFSLSAVIGTVAGFVTVQMIAMLFLSIALSRKEPLELLQSDSPDKQVSLSGKLGWFSLILGLFFLTLAYGQGVTQLRSFEVKTVLLILISGGVGTFLLYRGLGIFIGHHIQRKSQARSGLYTFTGRQIQENVIHHYKVLAIASLLMMMALACVSFGIGMASGRGPMDNRTVDFSVEGSEQDVRNVLDSEANQAMVSAYYPMFISSMETNTYDQSGALLFEKPNAHTFSWEGLINPLMKISKSHSRDNMLNIFSENSAPYLISETSYNSLLQSIGKAPIQLERHEVALYTSNKDNRDFINILESTFKLGANVEVDAQKYTLLPNVYSDNVVADRKITLFNALIVSDENYTAWVSENDAPFCWNVLLSEPLVKENGLIQSIQLMAKNIEDSNLTYESYLDGIGRNLFFTIAASYLTIYLGVLFMVIANTVIGLKYLMQQRADKQRYLTLLTLGADSNGLIKSATTQIRLFFGLVLGLAVVSSIFAIWSMYTSFLQLPIGISLVKVALISGVSAILFIVIEWIYIQIVTHISKRELLAIQRTYRG